MDPKLIIIPLTSNLTIIAAAKRNKNKNARSTISDSTLHSSRISTSHMENLLEQLKQEGNRDSTKKVYHTIWKNFNKFLIRLDRMPKTWEDRTCIYCTHLICEKGLQSSTVRSYISAIKWVLKNDDYNWDDGKLLLNTLTKSCKVKNDKVKTRLPIQKGLLEMVLFELRRKFCDQPYLEALYISAFLLAYYGLMRVGEITASPHSVKAVDIYKANEYTPKKRVFIVLRSSKTHDTSMLPQKIKIHGFNSLEIVNNDESKCYTIKDKRKHHFCPVDWIVKFTEMRNPIVLESENLFIFRDGSKLEAIHLRNLLRETIKSFDLNPAFYDTHSFRIGRATDLFKAGVPVDTIKHLGRWRSNAVYKYLRDC